CRTGQRPSSVRVGDLDEDAPALAKRARAHERAQRASNATLPADHLADVVCGDVQHEDERSVAFLLLDADRIGVVDELAREIREQLRHRSIRSGAGEAGASAVFAAPPSLRRVAGYRMPWILISFATASVGCAPLP